MAAVCQVRHGPLLDQPNPMTSPPITILTAAAAAALTTRPATSSAPFNTVTEATGSWATAVLMSSGRRKEALGVSRTRRWESNQ